MTGQDPGPTTAEPTSDHDRDQPIFEIDDPRIPHEIREHGQRFRKPARLVMDFGNDEYILFAADGELLDVARLK